MTYDETTKQYEQTQNSERLFNDLVKHFAPDPESGNYLGNEYVADSPNNRVREVRFVSVQEQDELSQYIDVGFGIGELKMPLRVKQTGDFEGQGDLVLCFGEVEMPQDDKAIAEVLGWVLELAENDELSPIDAGENGVIDTHVPPYFYV